MDDSPAAETIVSATTPRGEIALRERADPDAGVVHELIIAGTFAVDSLDTSTETRLAEESLSRTAAPERVLVAGLGLGFTTWQVLKDKRVRHVDVVEIEADLVQWARLGLAPTLGLVARHPRVGVHAGDVAGVLRGEATPVGPWDLVLLDVDNGPSFLLHEGNERLYRPEALAAALAQVSPGGTLAIWAAQREPELLTSLERLAPTEEVVLEVERQGRRLEYALYLTSALP
jgi:spermidine synthase